MTRWFLVLPAAALMVSCGGVSAPVSAQASRPSEETPVRAFANECAKLVAGRMLDASAVEYAFVTPGATCTNEFLGADALSLPDFLKSTTVTPGGDLQVVNIRLVSKTNRKYLLQMDVDWATTFTRLP